MGILHQFHTAGKNRNHQRGWQKKNDPRKTVFLHHPSRSEGIRLTEKKGYAVEVKGQGKKGASTKDLPDLQ